MPEKSRVCMALVLSVIPSFFFPIINNFEIKIFVYKALENSHFD